MSRLDVVIFGATGFTGRHAAIEMARVAAKYKLTWGVAGRSQSRLEDVMRKVAEVTVRGATRRRAPRTQDPEEGLRMRPKHMSIAISTSREDQSHVKIIIAEVTDDESLKQMCSQAKVIANCCGPYRLYGEPVVRACVACRTHLVDVTGEPQFIESMQLKYHEEASEAGVYIVNACGFDSIPNDMGVVFLQKNFGGTVNSVESYLSSNLPPEYIADAKKNGVIHYGTWESLVYSVAHWGELKPIRQKLYPTKLPSFKPKLMPQRVIQVKHNKYTVPFPGSDNSILYRSQRHLYEKFGQRPVQFRAYQCLESWFQAVIMIIGGALIALMAQFSITRSLLLNHPRTFSGGLVSRAGPSPAVMDHTAFRFQLYGEGWAEGTDINGPLDKKIVVKVSGTNPGYGATVTALIFSALTVLRENDKMPDKGGVLTTAVAFKDTDLIKNLHENGLKFEVIESTSAKS